MSENEDRPVEEDKQGAARDPRPLDPAVAERVKAKKPDSLARRKKARTRERKKRNMGPFE